MTPPRTHAPRRARRRTLLPAVLAALLLPTGAAAGMAAAPAPAVGGSTPAAAAAGPDLGVCPWMDTSLAPEQRARLLLDASTLHQRYRWLVEQPANNPTQTTFSGVEYPEQVPCTPQVTYTDGPDGVRFTTGVTAFPAPIALAATWDTALAGAKGDAQGDEAFAVGKNGVLGPGIASGRTPLSGRTPEYLGEDSLLSGLLGAAVTNGLQDFSDGTGATADIKHFVANEQELDRQTSSSNLSERTLREVYGLPFEILLSESGPASVMCSYNQINGDHGCENSLLESLLKDDYGFDGYVVSDFGAVHSTAASLRNGLDQELNRPRFLTPALLDAALSAGEITVADVDAAALRVVTAYIRHGLFDHPLPAQPATSATSVEHRAIALRTAQEGSVLLKNQGALPLDVTAGQTIALIGPTASATVTDGLSAASVCSMAWRFNNAGTLACENLVTPEQAITARAAEVGATVVWDAGTDLARAAAVAASADVAVVFGHQRTGEFSDLPDLRLQDGGDALVEAVAAAHPGTVVVLQTGSAVEMPWIDEVGAVLETWYAGEQMGPSLAGLLFGDANPSGKLPMTFPASLADTPTAASPEQYPGTFADGSTTRPAGSTEIRQVEYAEGLAVGYRWYQSQGVDPLFAFGHGLSYTTYAYDGLQVTPRSTDGTKDVRVRVRVTNTGDVAGTETVQVYATLPASTDEPGTRLVGWQKVTLQPGERRQVTVTLDADDLADHHLLQHWDERTGRWATAAGVYGIAVGGSSQTTVATTVSLRDLGALRASVDAARAAGQLAGPAAYLVGEHLAAAERLVGRGRDANAATELERLAGRLVTPPAGSTVDGSAAADLRAQVADAVAALRP